jgi:predicted O-methyltransferase YrrM
MPLPKAVRRLAPDRLRHDPRLRAAFVGAGVIPPRTMHSAPEAALLRELAAGRRRVVEIGVYEGSSAVVLCEVLGPEAELHLVDPFGHHADALPAGWAATERAGRRVVARAVRRHDGPGVHWHIDFSAPVARRWRGGEIDLLFIDGDHREAGVAEDWELWHGLVGPGGTVVFHDARAGRPDGRGLPGPTAVVDRLFRGPEALEGWAIAREADRAVAVTRAAAPGTG